MSEGLSTWKRIWNSKKNQPGEQDEDMNTEADFSSAYRLAPGHFLLTVFGQKPEDRAISKSQTMGKGFKVISNAKMLIIPHGLPFPIPKVDLSTPRLSFLG